MAKPTWQGLLRLSLVSCPVALYNAVSPGSEVRFNLINPETGNRVRNLTVDAETEEPVNRSDLVKGFEIEKNVYVTVTPDELNAVRLPGTKTLDIDRFVDAAEIDRLYWDHPYFLVPDGKSAEEPFAVINAAMAETGQIGLGTVVISNRERLIAIEPRAEAMIATTLRSFREVRPLAAFSPPANSPAPEEDMVSIAKRILEQKRASFDPRRFEDHYEEALRDLIDEKRRGGATVHPQTAAPAPMLDLMEALRASLEPEAPANDRGKPRRRRKAS